ncbi:MAG: DUF2088 domain-containing protein, partial [Candidatus Magnetomorum sp.]|nr:DUF2088 domain-containing protein [Candidatus Magnetomorum sp.]
MFLNTPKKRFPFPFDRTKESLSQIKIASVEQHWPENAICSVEKELSKTFSNLQLTVPEKTGETVGIAVGSRGIDQLAFVVRQCVNFLKSMGYDPFIIPAMGSHGNATPEGQCQVLETFGITEDTMSVPIRADMATLKLGEQTLDSPVYFSKTAIQADHIVVINRIKSHTKFHAPVESGLCKMLCIGLGKATGAAAYHQQAVLHGFSWIEPIARMILHKQSVLFGIGLIENQYGRLAHIEAIPGKNIPDREKKLLQKAKSLMPSIPFDPLDVLIINEIGKNISGIGMDSNITGRHRDITGDFFNRPHVKRIFIRNLSHNTHGNANGIGLADVITTRCLETIDFEKTYMNALTALSPEKAAIPLFFNTDKECLAACLHTIGYSSAQSLRLVWIENTACLDRFFISEGLQRDLKDYPLITRITNWAPILFDSTGN